MGRVMSSLCVVLFFAASGFANVIQIHVNNASFEDLSTNGLPFGCGTGCHYSTMHEGILDWTIAPGSSEFTGQFQPGTQDGNHEFFNSLPAGDGITSAYTASGTISQEVGPTVQPGVIYTLMVALGRRNDSPFVGSADLLLSGVGQPVVIKAHGTRPTHGNWSTFAATFTGTAAEGGNHITIELNAHGPHGSQGNFDSVRLAETTVIPEPGTLGLLELT